MTMGDDVDKLRETVGADSDIALAAILGLERSTISQWRRRGQVPNRYRGLVDVSAPVDLDKYVRRSDRRSVYGDGYGRYILSAALAFIPPHALDFGPNLSAGNVGWARESRLMGVVQIVLEVCTKVLGKARCENDEEYIRLINALEEESVKAHISLALIRGAVGEI